MNQIDELLTRGVQKIYPSKEAFEKILRGGKKLRVYQGFDPTGSQLHIGHMAGLRKLKQFQDLGHHVIFLIGDATIQAGDPSGKTTPRDKLRWLIVKSVEDKPGILRKVAELFELENVNMTKIDSQKTEKGAKFKIGIDKTSPPEAVEKVMKSLISHGFSVEDEFRQNAKNYIEQASKVVSFKGKNPAEIRYNGDWLNQLNLAQILNITVHFSLQQMSERDLFQERIKKGESVNLREFLYPLLQAYDSVAMNIDVEVGGSDQTFNMLCGRTLVKIMQNREKFVMTTPLLTDQRGIKIGKTEDNVIAINDPPCDLFGEIMGLSDDVIIKGLEYLTDVPIEEIEEIEKALSQGQNPFDYKKRLAFEVVKQLNNEQEAKKAQEDFENTFQKGKTPENIMTAQIKNPQINMIDFLAENKLVESKSQAKRLLDQGAIEIDGETLEENQVEFKDGQVVKIGKRKFVKVKVS